MEKKFDAIFALSFGKRVDGPGASNISLAFRVMNARLKLGIPVVSQKEIADALGKRNIKVEKVISQHVQTGKYLDTVEVVRQCSQYCTEHDYKKLLVIAHPDHQKRVAFLMRKFGLEAVLGNTREVPYDKKSIQIWTRTKILFRAWNTLAWADHLIKFGRP